MTGLPMAVWVTENDGYSHDVQIKVSRLKSGGGRWRDAVSVTVHPMICEEIVPPGRHPVLPTADLSEVCAWINLNRDVIVDFWNGVITVDEAIALLRRL